jgi:hypothetical protein
MQYVRNNNEVTAAWPPKRSAATKAKTKQQNDWFKQVQYQYKFEPAAMQLAIMEARKKTPLLPRDLYMMLRAGTVAAWTKPDGTRLFSMQTMQAVSASLDAICQIPGYTLVRGEQFWQGQAAGQNLTETAWAPLTFSQPAMTNWGHTGLFQCDQTMQIVPGTTIEVEVKMARWTNTQDLILLSSNNEQAIMLNWVDYNHPIMAQFLDTTGAYNQLVDQGYADTVQLYATRRIRWTEGSADGQQNTLAFVGTGVDPDMVAQIPQTFMPMTGVTRPIIIQPLNGLADLLMARYRLIGPLPTV